MSKATQLNEKPTSSPKKKNSGEKKTTTTGTSTTKRSKKIEETTAVESSVNTAEIIGRVKDADSIISTGIKQLDRIEPKIDKLIEKSSKDVTALRDKAAESGSNAALNAEITVLNQLNMIKARISRYSSLIRDNSQGLDKRVAFVGFVVPLIETIDDIGKQKG